ncbi:MAG: hypothetical protein ABEJ68_10320 [Halobacteriaceae archaeon]
MTHAGGPQGDRAQSETLGFILLVGIAAIGVTSIVVLGSAAVDNSRHAMEVGSAEHAMTEFDSQASLVAHGASTSQIATLPSGRGQRVQVLPNAGRMTVKVYNKTGGLNFTVLNTTLGAVKYTNGDTTIAYEGGGVWKRTESGSVTMVSPPEVHYSQNTLTLPLVTVRGDGNVVGTTRIQQAGVTDSKFPSATHSNPLQSGQIVLTVRSDYYRAWGRFFETRTGGNVTYDHPNETVSIDPVAEESKPAVAGGIISGATADEIQFQNQGGVDSYNSSAGDYSSTNTRNTTIVAAGSVTLQNKATIYGDVVAGADLSLYNQATIDGNASYGGSLSMDNKATITGTISDDASVQAPDAVNFLVDRKLSNFSSSNDNGAENNISSNTLQGCDTTCTIENGRYYLSGIQLDTGDDVVFDTSNGSIEVAVAGPVQIQGDAHVEVQGGGTVRFYNDDYVQLQNDANVTVPGEDAPRLWMYMRSDTSFELNNKARFVGVIYGPGRGTNSGATIDVNNQAQIYGALVGRVPAVPNGVGVHFDEALTSADPLEPVFGGTPRVTYLHVSTTPINVTT